MNQQNEEGNIAEKRKMMQDEKNLGKNVKLKGKWNYEWILGEWLRKALMNRRGMPGELMNELFGSLPFENAFGLLAKIPNGLLARNVQKMIIGIKIAMKNNKLNAADSSPYLAISEDGLVIKHYGSNSYNSVRAVLSIPSFNLNCIKKPKIAFYFEMEILEVNGYGIGIGYCAQHFLLQRRGL